MKKTLLIAFLMVFLFVPFVQANTITVPTNTYFGFGTGAYINFNKKMTFDTVYRENNYWYFDGYGFQVQNANMTITNYFVDEKLIFTVTAPSETTSISKVYVSDKGEPVDVVGESSWSYDSGTKILTILRTHSSTHEITVDWAEAPPDTEPPTYSGVAHNTTIAGHAVEFSSYWDDNIALSHYIFCWNGTGSWANETAVAFGSTPSWANATKTLPLAGTLVGYLWYVNDTSNNWATTLVFTLTTTAIGENVVVLLNQPSDGATKYSKVVEFTYTPIFYQTIQNTSLWLNVSGTWQRAVWNNTVITNNTLNVISYTFTDSGTFIWNIQGYNSTDYIFAEFNRTLFLSVEPYCDSVSSSYYNFYSHWQDGDGISGYIFSWNATGIWQNTTWVNIPNVPTDTWITHTQSPHHTPLTNIGYRFYVNDTDDNCVGTSMTSFIAPYFATEALVNYNNTLMSQGNPYLTTITNTITGLSYGRVKLSFTVLAPTSITSVTKVYVSNKGKPVSVTGATSYSYDSATRIETVIVQHSSNQEVTLTWIPEAIEAIIVAIRNNYYLVFGLISLAPIIIAATIIISLIRGKEQFDPKQIVTLIPIFIILIIGYIVIFNVMNSLIGG